MTGDAIGQVSSQTLPNLAVISQALLPKAQQHLAASNQLASQLGMSVCSKA